MSSGRRKTRISVVQPPSHRSEPLNDASSNSFTTMGSRPSSMFMDEPSGRKPRSSVSMDAGAFPSGRKSRASMAKQPRASTARQPRASMAQQPRASVVKQGDFPIGRQPRASIAVMKEATVVQSQEFDEEQEEERAKRRRKRIAIIIACILAFVLIIVIIVILTGSLGTGDGPSEIPPDAGVPEGCAINNATKPETYDEFMCDLLTTLTDRTKDTFLKTYPTSSVHGKAIGWMLSSDRIDYESIPREIVLERYVMILFYFSTGGREWYTRFAFLSPEEHVCDWGGDSKDALRCAFSDRKVTDLGMPNNGLNGAIPSEIGYMTDLTRIYFSINQLTGTIPSEMALLTKLGKLYLDRNSMRGKIPEGINDLNLTTLTLNNNDFNGNLTRICDRAAAFEFKSDYHSDCGEDGRVDCHCCKTCL